MKKMLFTLFVFTAALGLIAAPPTTVFAPDCGSSCSATIPITFVGSGFQKNSDVEIISQGSGASYGAICTSDNAGNLTCPAISLPADSYNAYSEVYSLHTVHKVVAVDAFVVH